jgi:hypothetical protein
LKADAYRISKFYESWTTGSQITATEKVSFVSSYDKASGETASYEYPAASGRGFAGTISYRPDEQIPQLYYGGQFAPIWQVSQYVASVSSDTIPTPSWTKWGMELSGNCTSSSDSSGLKVSTDYLTLTIESNQLRKGTATFAFDITMDGDGAGNFNEAQTLTLKRN